MTIRIQLRKDRRIEGRLIVLETGAFFRCLGKSDQASADAAGNPLRDPLKKMGDLPTGSYIATRIGPAGATDADIRSYGPGARWALRPISGDALQAWKDGRDGIEIHGGDVGAPMPPNALRPTHGCCRIDNTTVNTLAAMPGSDSFPVEVVEVG